MLDDGITVSVSSLTKGLVRQRECQLIYRGDTRECQVHGERGMGEGSASSLTYGVVG